MLNLQKSIFDSKFYQELQVETRDPILLSIIIFPQDSTDNFLLLNNLLNLDESRKESDAYLEGKDWLDLVDFKDEAGFYGSDSPPPVKDSERKRKHNKSESWAQVSVCARPISYPFFNLRPNYGFRTRSNTVSSA